MARNVELKARCADLAAAERVCQRLGAKRMWRRQQTDVYFAVPDGRLKLRVEAPGGAVLVRYHRPDAAEARESCYELTRVADPAAAICRLEAAHGVLARVQKTRTLWLLDNVRIHLDAVEGLGTFIEFEAVLDTEHGAEEARERLAALVEEFGIADGDLLGGSYSDMLRQIA